MTVIDPTVAAQGKLFDVPCDLKLSYVCGFKTTPKFSIQYGSLMLGNVNGLWPSCIFPGKKLVAVRNYRSLNLFFLSWIFLLLLQGEFIGWIGDGQDSLARCQLYAVNSGAQSWSCRRYSATNNGCYCTVGELTGGLSDLVADDQSYFAFTNCSPDLLSTQGWYKPYLYFDHYVKVHSLDFISM